MPSTPRKIHSLRDYNDPGHVPLEDGMVSQNISESAKALRGGWIGTGAALQGSMASGSRMLGFDKAAEGFEAKADAQEARLAHPMNRPRLNEMNDAQTPLDWLELGRNKVLEQVPLGAGLAAGALGGALVAPAAIGAGTGALAGTGLAYHRISSGDNYNEYRGDEQVRATHTPREIAKQAEMYGGAQTLLGMVPIGTVLNRGRAAAQAGKPLLNRIGRGAAIGAGTESVTELGEEMLQRHGHQGLNPNVEMFDEEAINRYKNAAFAGAVGGGTFGSIGGAMSLGSGTKAGGLHTPEGMPEPEALKLFDDIDLGLAARRYTQKALQAGEDGAVALRTFALRHADSLPPNFFESLETSLKSGLDRVMPMPRGDKLDEQMRDEDAREQVRRAQSRTTMQRLHGDRHARITVKRREVV